MIPSWEFVMKAIDSYVNNRFQTASYGRLCVDSAVHSTVSSQETMNKWVKVDLMDKIDCNQIY